jgi:hypothetical protein
MIRILCWSLPLPDSSALQTRLLMEWKALQQVQQVWGVRGAGACSVQGECLDWWCVSLSRQLAGGGQTHLHAGSRGLGQSCVPGIDPAAVQAKRLAWECVIHPDTQGHHHAAWLLGPCPLQEKSLLRPARHL